MANGAAPTGQSSPLKSGADARTAFITILAGIISAGATIGVAYLGGFFNVANTREASVGTIRLEKLKFSNDLIKNALSTTNPANSLLFYADIGLLDPDISSKVRNYAEREKKRLKEGDTGTSLLPNFSKSVPPTLRLDREFMATFAPRARPEFVNALVSSGNYLLLGFGINKTAERLAVFLAHIANETEGFTKSTEPGSYYTKTRLMLIFPNRFDAAKAEQYAGQPEKIFNYIYASRMGNGPESSGDGWRFRGRGYLQFTGRTAYERYSKEVGIDLVQNPDLMADPNVSLLIAALFWTKNGLNELADKDDLRGISRKVTGSAVGFGDLNNWTTKAKKLLQERAVASR